MTSRILLGMLTPSSNTTLEPVTTAMIAGLPEASAHFGRFKVTEIALTTAGAGPVRRQRDPARRRAVVARQGRRDRLERHVGELARLRHRRAAVPPHHRGHRRPGLHLGAGAERDLRAHGRHALRARDAVPRRRAGRRSSRNYAAAGYECVAERHLGLRDNFTLLRSRCRRHLGRWCATWPAPGPMRSPSCAPTCAAARWSQALEAETGIPIYDSIATVVWKALRLVGADTRRIKGWGRLFQMAI